MRIVFVVLGVVVIVVVADAILQQLRASATCGVAPAFLLPDKCAGACPAGTIPPCAATATGPYGPRGIFGTQPIACACAPGPPAAGGGTAGPGPTSPGGAFSSPGTPMPTTPGGIFTSPFTPMPTSPGGVFTPPGTPGGIFSSPFTPIPTGPGGVFTPPSSPIPSAPGGVFTPPDTPLPPMPEGAFDDPGTPGGVFSDPST